MAAADIATGPAKPTYSAGAYWDTRYTGPAKNFDWFYNYPALKALFRERLPAGRVLHVGCGNSNIQEGMAADGFTVTNVDISPVVIEQMKHQHAEIHTLDYLVADCRDMHQLSDDSFQSCIDKGTLDAVLCSQSGQGDTVKYLHEINRLLQPGGTFLLISLGAPGARLALLQKQHWSKVEVLLLPKPLLYLQSDASISGNPLPSQYAADKDEPIRALGPWPADEAMQELASREIETRHYFFAYICVKAPCEQAEGPPQQQTQERTQESTRACTEEQETKQKQQEQEKQGEQGKGTQPEGGPCTQMGQEAPPAREDAEARSEHGQGHEVQPVERSDEEANLATVEGSRQSPVRLASAAAT